MRRLPQQQRNANVLRERDPRAFRRLLVVLAGGLLLTGGFVVAVGQHFKAVDYGYRSETLRREREQLLAEQQRLQLALDEAASPAALARAAAQIGMQPARAAQMTTAPRADAARTVPGTPASAGPATARASRR
ncbi:MAG TPA: hypothetical protein VF525_20195 [Pyrinomonadaceae bacterium]|jgi:hypothetical protein